jgi:hypothetical protein
MRYRWVLFLIFFGLPLLLERALAHEPLNIQSGSLNAGAQVSVWFFMGIFGLILLGSLGGLIYNLIPNINSSREISHIPVSNIPASHISSSQTLTNISPNKLSQVSPTRKNNWTWAFAALVITSSLILLLGASSVFAVPPLIPQAVLYPQGWQVSYGRGALEQGVVTVPVQRLTVLHLGATQSQQLRIAQLGLDVWLEPKKGQDVTFSAPNVGEFRSSGTPALTVRALSLADYQKFEANH